MSQNKYCTECGEELVPNAEFCKSCGTPISTPQTQTVTITSRPPRFPLRSEHKLLIGFAVLSIALTIAMPLASAPQKLTTVETQTTTRINPYLTTYVHLETRTVTTAYVHAWTETSFYTVTYTATIYVTTVIYTGGTVFQQWGTGTATIGPGVIVVIPIQIQQTQVQSTVLQHTRTVGTQQAVTETRHSVVQQVSSAVETVRQTATLPYSSAVIRSYLDNLTWIGVAIILPILAYHRINAYRTRLHIYYEILDYTAYSSRLSSHIMRACNLETGKFERYMGALTQKGLVDEIKQDGGKAYRASPKGLNIVRNQDIKRFVEELP